METAMKEFNGADELSRIIKEMKSEGMPFEGIRGTITVIELGYAIRQMKSAGASSDDIHALAAIAYFGNAFLAADANEKQVAAAGEN
jgi:hypothetical protein